MPTYRGMVKMLFGPSVDQVGRNTVQRLLGFHAVWHLYGGEKGLKDAGWGHTTVWRNRRDFLAFFKVDVEDAFPEQAAPWIAARPSPVKRVSVSHL